MKRALHVLVWVALITGAVVLAGQQASAQPGTTVSILCSQYLRPEPTDSATRIGRMNPGETHTAIGRYGDWLYLQVGADIQGWAYYGDCLLLNGSFEALPLIDVDQLELASALGPPTAGLTCTQYLRRGPSEADEALQILTAADAPLSMSGRTTDNAWMQVTTASGRVGWTAYTDCLAIQGDFSALPVLDQTGAAGAPVATLTCTQNLRAFPSNDGQQVAQLGPSVGAVEILGRTADYGWVYVSTAEGQGWMAADACLNIRGDLTTVPLMEIQGTATTPLVGLSNVPAVGASATIACAQYMRALPQLDAARLAIMEPGDGVYQVQGRNEDASWLYLSLPGSFQGWAGWGDCLNVTGNIVALPVLDSVGYSGAPIATVACTQYLRTLPDLNARTLDPMTAGTSLNILGRSEDGAWVLVSKADGSQGWTALGGCLNVQGNVYDAPVVSDATYSGAPQAVVSCTQYLREYPDDNSERLAILNGTEGTLWITGRSLDEGWMQVTMANGTVGWAATGVCLGVRGNYYDAPIVDGSPAAYSGPPLATVNCSQYLREAPEEDAPTVVILNGVEGDLRITARTADDGWMQIAMEDGTTGWAATNACLGVQGRLSDAPVVDLSVPEYTGPAIASVACNQNLRSVPATEGERLAVLAQGEAVDVLGRTEDTEWLYLRRAADGLEGWSSAGGCLAIDGNILLLPVTEVSTYDGPPVADVVCDINLRRTPSQSGDVLTVLSANTGEFNILARDADLNWLLIEGGSGIAGWVNFSDCVVTRGTPAAVPVPGGLNANPELQTVLRAEGACNGADQVSQLISAYNRTSPLGPVSRQCTSSGDALLALAQFRAEIAIVDSGCPGFQAVSLSGGQSVCVRAAHTTQVDDFLAYVRGR
jgi:uncharacterized protein YgiM (DUF1202 family)